MQLWGLAYLLLATPAAVRDLSYWIEPCTRPETQCQAGDPELAGWALDAWQSASPNGLHLKRAADRLHARIRIVWASAELGLYGEARPIEVGGMRGAEVYVRPAPLISDEDALLRDAVVYLTCLHETGHALGLAHTAEFNDIVYSFQYGGDIPEYFGRYRRKLRTRADIQKNSGLSEEDRKHLAAALQK